MSKYGKHKGRKAPTFLQLRHDMMGSPAWLSLSPRARCVWIVVAGRYNSYNNGEISLSCREVCDNLHISKSSATAGFNELIDRGFIKIAQQSSFTMKTKTARRWTLTHESVGKTPPTNEWRKWRA